MIAALVCAVLAAGPVTIVLPDGVNATGQPAMDGTARALSEALRRELLRAGGYAVRRSGSGDGTARLRLEKKGQAYRVRLTVRDSSRRDEARSFEATAASAERIPDVLAQLVPFLMEAAGTMGRPNTEVRFSTEPPGAEITLDGEIVGLTDLTLRDVAPGKHSVVLSLHGHAPGKAEFRVRRDSSVAVERKLEKIVGPSSRGGVLRIETEPREALVRLNGVLMGVAPILLTNVPPGRHRLRATQEGFFAKELRVESREGRTNNVLAKLRPLRPRDIPSVTPLPYHWTIARSALFPGLGQFRAQRYARGTVFLSGFALAGLGWASLGLLSQSYHDDYNDAIATSVMDATYLWANRLHSWSVWSGRAAIGLYVLGIADTAWAVRCHNRDVRALLSLRPRPGGVDLAWRF